MLTRTAPLIARRSARRCNISLPHTSIIQGRGSRALRSCGNVYTPAANNIQI
jgi:hypothetical protein